MKVLIVSDTHGWRKEIADLKKRYEGKVDALIHCGDSELDPDAPEISGYLTVQGNCDLPGAFPSEQVKTIGPLTLLVAHGHLLDVGRSPAKLLYRGLEAGAQIVCFGHTHFAGSFQENGLIFINPGSLRLPRNYREGTFAVLDADEQRGQISINYYTMSGEAVDTFSKTFDWNK